MENGEREEQIIRQNETPDIQDESGESETVMEEREQAGTDLQEMNQKYLRLYADFENYKKRVARDKEELIKYGNESLIYELLPVIDNLEMALKHSNDTSSGVVQGVEVTLKELKRVLDKFGLAQIEAENKQFDPALHHAMSQVERDDVEDNTVVEEYRKGYKLKDKVLRPSLVAVSKKPDNSSKDENEEIKIKINKEEDS